MAIDKSGAAKAHTRVLEINTYEVEQGLAIVEGTLKDDCFVSRYLASGDQRPPGTIHHMIVRMKIRSPDMTIEEVEAEMPSIPRQECIETIDTLKPLEGMRIASGFTLKVKEMLGGPKSCAHMVSLVLAMAPAAVQGVGAATSQRPLDLSAYAQRVMGFLTDTCWVWRKGGPLEQAHREQLKDYLETK
ncbi:MAG: DUF2889 domain-containing protein [Desulfobacterales bacterium]